jgi:uncharacterized phage-associated protein
MATANNVVDYLLGKIDEAAGDSITHLKIQKLVYYCQAWSLAITGDPIFAEEIQAWQHGPVIRSVWNRFSGSGFEAIPTANRNVRSARELSRDQRELVDEVWEAYGNLSGAQLRTLTHREQPWIDAREGLAPDAPSSRVITKASMQSYYAARVAS